MKRVLAPAALFLALLAVYAALRQDVQYGDGISFLVQLRDRFLCGHNWLYLPVLDGFVRAQRPWASEPVAAGLFSAVCAAGGGAFLLAWLLSTCQDLGAALAATLLLSLSPAILFFATTIENHAHHLLWLGAFLLALGPACAARAAAWTLLPGALLVLVFGSHQTGILLVPAVALLLLAWRQEQGPLTPRAELLRLCALLLPLAAVKLFQVDRWLKAVVLEGGAEFWQDEGVKVFREQVLGGAPLSQWPGYWWSDFLDPAFGLVLAAALSLLVVRRHALERLAVAAALVPYLMFFARWHIPERGAYFTAVWPLLALLVARGITGATGTPRRALLGLCAVLAAAQTWVGVARIQDFERADPYRAWSAQVRRVAKPGTFLLVASDMRALHGKYWAGLDTMQAQALHNQVLLSERNFPGALQQFPAVAVADLRGRAGRGQELLVEAEAWRYFTQDWPPLAQALDAAFRRVALPDGQGLAGFRLEVP